MKYIPKIPDGDVNIPKENILKTFLFISITFFIIIYIIYFMLGVWVDIIAEKIPWEYEKKLGYIQFQKSDGKKRNEKQEKLQKILDGLIKYSDLKDKKFTVRIYETEEKNALALPGGDIVVFSGLLKITGNDEKKIAAVLAHELGHYAHRDHLRAIGRILVLHFISRILFNSENLFGKLYASSLNNIQLKYSRDQEKKADLYAVDLLYKKYKKPEAMVDVLNKMGQYEKIPKYFFFFSTHPSFEDRIKTIKKYMDKKGYKF